MDVNAIRFTIFLGVFALMLLLEALIQRHPTVDSKPRRFAINLGLTGVDIIVVKLLFGTAAVGAAAFAEDQSWGVLNYLNWPVWLEITLAVILLDFSIYVQHVVVHMIPFFWRFHKVHHTDLDLDVSSALRFHPVEIIGSMLFKISIIFALGPTPLTVMIFEAILNGMAQFSHSNIKLPEKMDSIMRWFFVTPDMHRIHHSEEIDETNSNYGFNFSIWDRALGTYIAEARKTQPEIILGIKEYKDPREVSFLNLLIIPFRKS
jgi:sterol desaturase/sphingolipid hydroxylase (fatty acid hydroxylase superfamily)